MGNGRTVDQRNSFHQLQLSPEFTAELDRQGKDFLTARRATGRLLVKVHTDKEIARLQQKFAQGWVDPNATFTWNGRQHYIFHELFAVDMANVLRKALPSIKEEILHLPVQPKGSTEPRPALHFGSNSAELLGTLLLDGRLDPWEPDDQGRTLDSIYTERLRELRWASGGDKHKRFIDFWRTLVQCGFEPSTAPGVPACDEYAEDIRQRWNHDISNSTDTLLALDSSALREFCATVGYGTVFNPTLWRGHEAEALDRIDHLPAWARRFVSREQPALEAAVSQPLIENWTTRVRSAAPICYRGAP